MRTNFPAEAAKIADERDRFRRTNLTDPNIRTLTNKVYEIVHKHLHEKWHTYLDKCDFNQNTNNLWRVIKNLFSKPVNTNNINIKFNDKATNNVRKMAN